jgi:hypothetical protein
MRFYKIIVKTSENKPLQLKIKRDNDKFLFDLTYLNWKFRRANIKLIYVVTQTVIVIWYLINLSHKRGS